MFFNHSFTFDNIPQSFTTFKIDENQKSSWNPDTRAKDHMTTNQGNLHSLTSYNGANGVMVGNGDILPLLMSAKQVLVHMILTFS